MPMPIDTVTRLAAAAKCASTRRAKRARDRTPWVRVSYIAGSLPNRDRAAPARIDARAIHDARAERHGDVAAAVDRHQAAPAAERRHIAERCRRRGTQGLPAIADAGGDLMAERGADEHLAVAGARDRARAVVGPGAGADDRRVADAPGHLAGD